MIFLDTCVLREWIALGFLTFGTVDILDWMILRCEGCPVHCRMLVVS